MSTATTTSSSSSSGSVSLSVVSTTAPLLNLEWSYSYISGITELLLLYTPKIQFNFLL